MGAIDYVDLTPGHAVILQRIIRTKLIYYYYYYYCCYFVDNCEVMAGIFKKELYLLKHGGRAAEWLCSSAVLFFNRHNLYFHTSLVHHLIFLCSSCKTSCFRCPRVEMVVYFII